MSLFSLWENKKKNLFVRRLSLDGEVDFVRGIKLLFFARGIKLFFFFALNFFYASVMVGYGSDLNVSMIISVKKFFIEKSQKKFF